MTLSELGIEIPDEVRPPTGKLPPGEWIRRNLFSNWYNSLLTIVLGAVIVLFTVRLVLWVFNVDWTVIRTNLALFMVGRWPRDQLDRAWYGIFVSMAGIGLFAGAVVTNAKNQAMEAGTDFVQSTTQDLLRRFWPVLMLIVVALGFTQTITPTLLTIAALATLVGTYLVGLRLPHRLASRAWVVPIVGSILFYFVVSGFGGVGWDNWNGFFLNIVLTIAGITLAFPLGLLLALGRRSSLPGVKWLSITYIEFLRGVPLISLLLMGSFALGFLIPGSTQFSLFIRILIAIMLFEAAYIAEVVRGGLQSVEKGQEEASQALGMPPAKTMRLIVLPQALRNVIPAMVGQFISLFKDTSLVVIVGLLDILRAAQVSLSQPEFQAQGLESVTFAFAGLFFWVVSYVMSRESRRLEHKLGVGTR